jgi:protein-disulfide isomerase
MFAVGRRQLLLGASALGLVGLAGCNNAGGGAGVTADDMVLGNADASVTLIEYASTTCSHCAAFHEEAWDQLKTNYIDTGRIRFILREFPTAPAAVAVAGFQLARCGGASPEQYYARVGELFRQQTAIFATGSMDGIRRKFIEIGGAAGLTEEQVLQCIADTDGAAERIRANGETAQQFNVTGTPTFIINGVKHEGAPTYEAISQAIDAALAG